MQNASPAALAAMQPLMMPSSQQFVPSAVQNAAHAAFAATQPFMMPSSQPQHVGPNAVQNASPAALAATQPLMMQNSQTPGISAKNVVQPLPSFEQLVLAVNLGSVTFTFLSIRKTFAPHAS